MNTRTTWRLIGIALALTAAVVWIERGGIGSLPTSSSRPVPLFDYFNPSQVTSIEVTRSNQTLRAERTGVGWRLTAPVAYPAEPSGIENLLGILEHSYRQTVIPAGDLEPFGLRSPAATVVMQFSTNRLVLNIGAKTLVGDNVYVHQTNAPDIVVTEGRLLLALPASLPYDWRDPSLVPPDSLSFDRLVVTNGNWNFQLWRNSATGPWWLNKPNDDTRADRGSVQYLLQQLVGMRVSQFVTDDPREDLDKYGLQNPSLRLALAQGTNELLQLHFGKSTNGFTYAKRSSHPNTIFLLLNSEQGLLGLLGKPHAYYRDHTFISLAAAESIDRIEGRADKETRFSLERQTGGAWQITEPFLAPADAELVQRFFSQLQQVRILDFAADGSTALAPYQLDPPARQYTLRSTTTNAVGRTNQLVAQLDFSAPLANQIDRAYAHRADENSVYQVGYANVSSLPKAAYELRDRQLWNFDSTNVTSIKITQRGRTLKLTRDPALGWSSDEIVREQIKEALYLLSKARVLNWTTRGEEQLPGFSLDHKLEIEVSVAGQSRFFTIQFGRRSASRVGVYAATTLEGDNQPVLFEFPLEPYERYIAPYLSIPDSTASNP